MKPQITCHTPVQYLKSVGPVKARALARLGIATAGDLLAHYPRKYFDRSEVSDIARLEVGREATVEGQILTVGERRTRRGGTIQTVSIQDSSAVLFCVWFNQRYLVKQFKSGLKVMCSGLVQHHAGRKQMVHPDFELLGTEKDLLHTGRLVPQYPTTQGIGQHWLRRLMHATLALLDSALDETLPVDLVAQRGLVSRAAALRGMHFPRDRQEQRAARRRLVYEELFLIQLTMALRRSEWKVQPGLKLARPGDLTRRFVSALPFELTGAQRRVLQDILTDLRSGKVMHRLLQGDVGSGKTIVALIAALFVIEQGYQAVLMAPTEVLARQHGKTCHRLTKALGLAVNTLTGATPAAERRAILAGTGQGEIDLLVGTHALIQDDLHLPNLGLAIVDEQHRFGVLQRGRTAQTSDVHPAPHVLVMSATPIPRSLSLTLYGDLDLSVIDELPHGRHPVQTHIVRDTEEDKIWEHVRLQVKAGGQAYVIYPVIEETEGQDLKAATVEFERLTQGPLRSLRLALLHGRLKPREKDEIMSTFAAGQLDVLVATTVIEVGVDVANATIIVINNPERFGLAQLHQLRGRVGRGEHQAHCFLMTDRWLAQETRERIHFFKNHHDGFALAEEDLRLRGPGDILGVRQHGLPGFRLANPLRDNDLVKLCSQDIQQLLAADPQLADPRHTVLRQTLEGLYGRLLPLRAG
jgi:ATP-dependent DNA helicase RecG